MTIDVAAFLADGLARRHPGSAARLQVVVRQVAEAHAQGHAGVRVTGLRDAGSPISDEALLRTGAVMRPGDPAMRELTLDRGLLAFTRYHRAEVALAGALNERLRAPPMPLGDQARRLLPRWFASSPESPDWQAVACIAALSHRFQIITGGPGTGKTTTVAKLLALVLADAPQSRIALAAPTGKAAQRLGGSIASAVGALASHLDPAISATLARVGQEATTLHRLLAWHGSDGRFRRTAEDPLPHDLVVIDEASMVDLLLFTALTTALRPEARLIVLGDAGQLASVDTGTVLSDCCRAAAVTPGCSERLSMLVRSVLGQDLPRAPVADEPAATPLRDAVVELRHSHRFGSDTAIGRAAAAIRAGDADRTLGACASDPAALVWDTRLESAIDAVLPAAVATIRAATVDQALQQLATARLLTAEREGPRGVAGLVARVEHRLAAQGLLPRRVPGSGGPVAYRGCPILINANDPDTGLANGDVGILWSADGADGANGKSGETQHLLAWFPDPIGGPARPFSLARLPPHQTAWAMTVHKSQGSEFATVALVLPAAITPLVCRQLLYTGLTRARQRAVIIADLAVLRHAVVTSAVRDSGLAERLTIR